MFDCGEFTWKHIAGALAVTGGSYAVCKLLKEHSRSNTSGETDNPYESVIYLNQYLLFNYGGPQLNCLFDGPQDGFDFPKKTADICLKYYTPNPSIPSRALDIACAVGRASFELTKEFSEVIGIDYSHRFIKTCQVLKQTGKIQYEIPVEGVLTTVHDAVVPAELDRSKCSFQQGDACNLPLSLGKFGCVLASNMICRLPNPKDFLLRLSNLVASGGICVITSPYTFMEKYTLKENWIGGFIDKNGKEVRAIDTMKKLLGPHFVLEATLNQPFLIRETEREHQWAVSHISIWRRK